MEIFRRSHPSPIPFFCWGGGAGWGSAKPADQPFNIHLGSHTRRVIASLHARQLTSNRVDWPNELELFLVAAKMVAAKMVQT